MSQILQPNEVHLWLYEDNNALDGEVARRYLALLSPEEGQKFQQYSVDEPQRQFLITRGMLRTLLSQYFPAIEPQAWEIQIDKLGKPFIANALETTVEFSISHTKGMLAIALGQNAAIGMDIENTCRKTKVLDIAQHFFSENEVTLLKGLGTPEAQRACFFKIWTLKEAFIKAIGKGIAVGLNQFSVAPEATPTPQIEFHNPTLAEDKQWQLWQTTLTDEHTLALVIGTASGEKRKIVQETFTPEG